MSDALHGIEEDVPFDRGTAQALMSFCTSTASTITGQTGTRNASVQTASTDFQGYFSTLFTDNASTARADAGELAARLGEIADHAQHLLECAEAEQARRVKAREWMKEREDRNLVEKGWDKLTGSEEDSTPPVGPPDPQPTMQTSAPQRGTRQTPAPGSGGGGGGGTSSARPEDLRSFATTSQGLNSVLDPCPARLTTRLDDFAAQCRWGTLEASGVVSGFRAWNTANDEDVAWARTVADAFAQAGGEGAVTTLSNSSLAASLKAAGVDAARQDLTIVPAQSFGAPPTTGYAVDPVNTATGNFLETEVDLGFGGASVGLRLERTYNSFDTGSGAFGPGWTSWTEARLDLDDEAARMTRHDGRVSVFPRLGTAWGRATGESLWLEATDDGYRVGDNQGGRWTYDRAGVLVELTAGPAAGVVRLERRDGLLVRLAHSRGRHLDLEWDQAGRRVLAVVAGDGRRVDHTFDEQGRLVAAAGPSGTRTYDWDDTGRLTRVVDADGVVEVDNDYDEQGRVVRQRTPHGRLVRLAYLPGQVTVVSDADGTRSNTWIHDRRGRLVGVVDADERRQSTSWDAHGNLVMSTERDGAVTVRAYDDRGRRTRTVSPEGADVTVGYDDLDRVTTVVAASGGVTEYRYADDSRNPAVVVDPEGGQMRLTWDDGLLTACEDPTGVRVEMAYDEHGDLVTATDAAGGTARLERDAVGRVVAMTTPGGSRTEMTYADSGLPLTRRDPDGALWRYEHTAAGRLSAVVDPLGGRTTVEHGPHGEQSRTVDPLGRTITSTVDDLGNPASTELPDGSVWRYTHDALSRLTTVTDPAGGAWHTEHDATGTVTATVDPTGRRRTVRTDRTARTITVDDGLVERTATVDAFGRLTASSQADGSVALVTYDRCGRAVELLDPEGNLTRIDRDAAGRPVASTGPTGAVTRFEHDPCGRVAAITTPGGARTTRSYDADGRLVRQTLATGESAWATYDACGRVTALHRPGSGTARFAYDAAGRVQESSDTWFGHRRYRHDAAGQLVSVTDGVGGVTTYDYDALGRWVATTDPTGAVTRREYDALHRCVAHTDPLGRTLRAEHDAAGRCTAEVDPDGVRTEWTHDASGRWSTRSVDGRTRSSLRYDERARVLTLTEPAADGRDAVVHELEYDRRQLLVRRGRGDRSVRWEYDAAGRRTARTTPDGVRVGYTHDADGHLVAVEHPTLGLVTLERDAAGRPVRSLAGRAVQTWAHRDGWVVAHTVTDAHGSRATLVERDGDGRITAVDHDGARTRLEHDAALRLVERRTGSAVSTWRYDAAGRLVHESVDGVVLDHEHDAAGQLVTTRGPDGDTTYSYDGSGRRVRAQTPDGAVRELGWSPEGRLASVVDHDPTGPVRRVDLHVDPTGELASVDGVQTWWDTAAALPSLVQVGDEPITAVGPFTGVGDRWATPGWRTARDGAAQDPWALAPGTPLPGGLQLGGAGELVVAGLEWMGARVYDPVSHGFLSVDPLPPVAGTGWAGDPYAFAGHDPLHALDPLGLRPATDADLQAFAAANTGPMAGVKQWVEDNTDYIIGGVVTAVGVAALFVPLPGAQIVGGMLISSGVNIIQQRHKAGVDGQIDLVELGIAAGFGAVGGVGTGLVMKAGVRNVIGANVLGGAGMGTAEGVVSGTYEYVKSGKPFDATDMLTTIGKSAGSNALTGALLGPVEAKVDEAALRSMWPDYTPPTGGVLPDNPGTPMPEVTIGSTPDLDVVRGSDGHLVAGNDTTGYAAVRQAVDHQQPVYVASSPSFDFQSNMDILTDAGYTRQGDYMVPPGS